MTAIPFVDAHIHLWDLTHISYLWLTGPFDGDGPNGSAEAIARDYGVADYRADLARWNVVGAVHIDAGADAAQALRETEWLEGLAAQTGLPTGIVAYADLADPGADALLGAHAAHARVRGIRQIVNWHADPQRTYGPRDVTQDDDWRRGMRALAALPQVAVKLSGLGFIWRDWTFERVRPLLLEAIELFGTDRCLFASDAPTDTLFAPIDRYMAAYHAVAEAFSNDERRALFGRNADRVYRLGLGI